MLQSTGFSYDKNFKFPMSGGNQAYVFHPDGPILVDSTLGLISQLKKKTKIGKNPKINPISVYFVNK